jgi:Fe-S oxidoreductase
VWNRKSEGILLMLETATREVFWQISDRWAFYALSFATLAALSFGLFKGIRFIRGGSGSSMRPLRILGLRATITDVLSHRPLAGEDSSRWWHLLVFYGFVILLFVTCYLMLAHYGHEALFTGMPYLLVSLVADLAGVAVIVGVLIALFTIRRDAAPALDRTVGKVVVLLVLGLVCVTGFLVEGLRIHLQGDPWKAWSPVGAAASSLFPSLAESQGHGLFKGLWWLHSVLALGLLAWIPLSARLRHMLFLPFHRAATPLEPRSLAPFIDVQALRESNPRPGTVRLGIETPADTTQRQRLGLLACMECGRCERLCPAFQTGHSLTPRKVLQDLRVYAMQSGEEGKGTQGRPPSPASEAITTDALWACRLCRACEEVCPAGIEHVPQMIEIRRAEVLGHGRLPDEGAAALRNLLRTGNPYGAGPVEKASWIREQQIPSPPAEKTGKPLLLWTGCFQPGDEQKPRVLSCLVDLLKDLEIPFFIPEETSCCGDPARILGEEDLFQALAREQIKVIEASGAEQVLVHCPHCYTALKDLYPLLGARFSAIHTSELLEDLIREKKLQGRGFPNPLSVVYHDPCFLSRYQDLADTPRSVLEGLPGLDLREPARARREGFCCGAGGGHFFMDLDLEERPSSRRLEELLAQGTEVLAVSCGFCFSMFDDALRRLPEPPALRIADWLELLREATEK